MKQNFQYRIAFILTIVCPLLLSGGCGGDASEGDDRILPDKSLERLSTTMKYSEHYQKIKNEKLDSLKTLLKKSNSKLKKWELMIELSDNYRQLNTDSAIYYATEAVGLAPSDTTGASSLRGDFSLVNALGTAGLFSPANRYLDSISSHIKTKQEKIEYWKSARMLYSYMGAFVQDHSTYSEFYKKKYFTCDDSLLNLLPQSDSFYKFILSERLVTEGRLTEAKNKLEELMSALPPESNLYGMSAFQLAEVYKDKGDFRSYATNLALAAESDIKGCVKEGIALPTLANWLYSHGDLDNAFDYINFALEDANSGNIRMRTVAISSLMPVIDEAYRKKINDSRNFMQGYLLVICTLFIIAVALIVFITRNMRKLRANEAKLSNTSKKLESYVGMFIGLCSNYASRLEQMSKLVVRKISAGQSDDLVKLISSGRFATDDNDEFYKLIDSALLEILPDFVEKINTLLLPEKQISLKEEEPLTPELRIYAFVRLGVDQSTRIAQILNYSVNTVYSYRNRMRNRAIDRENFDKNVTKLGTETASYEVI